MSKTVMTVDDSASMRQMISFTLQDASYNVIEAEDGLVALSKLQGCVLDLIITDLNMPRLDGMQLIRKIRSIPACKFIPVVMLTTESQRVKVQEAKASGATGWIVKPFKPAQLLAVVKKLIG
ncbi:MAG: response regulator [Candidatus Zixiibacteriota bacterium]